MYDFNKIVFLATELNSFEKDCLITVALKIVDKTCKMDEKEKQLFITLYDALQKNKTDFTDFFDLNIFTLINETRVNPSLKNFGYIKTFREDAMSYITKEKMKAFKANVRKSLLVN